MKFIKGQIPWNKGTKGVMKAWNKGISTPSNGVLENYVKVHGPWNKGKSLPQLIGNTNGFKKGDVAWNKGLHIRLNSGRTHFGKKENHPKWKGGVTPFNLAERIRFRKTIQKEVFKRDNFTCTNCGKSRVPLTVDHIQSWADYVELRFSMDNCRTLCQGCHYEITFGKPMPKEVKTWGHNFSELERMVD